MLLYCFRNHDLRLEVELEGLLRKVQASLVLLFVLVGVGQSQQYGVGLLVRLECP